MAEVVGAAELIPSVSPSRYDSPAANTGLVDQVRLLESAHFEITTLEGQVEASGLLYFGFKAFKN